MSAPVRLFQYWNTNTPPDEVRVLLETWGRDPGVEQDLFDQPRARAYLGDEFGSRLTAAFDVCANPALQSDLFRLAALYSEGGLYADADLGSLGRVAELIRPAPVGLLVALLDGPNNDLIFARHARLPLIGRLLERVVTNIEMRISNNVAAVSGPVVLMSLFDDVTARPLFDGWLVETRHSALRMISMPLEMDYKRGRDDWRNILMSHDRSIFTAADTPAAGAASFPVDKPEIGRLPVGSVALMQYADTMPDDAEGSAAIASWQSDPLFRHQFFDRAAANAYLMRTCGPGMVKAFARIDGEDRRADLLALVWLRDKGGLFVRKGLVNRGGWDWLLAAAPGGLLTGRPDTYLANDILYSPAPQSTLIVRSLNILSKNLLGGAVVADPKISALPPKLEVIMRFLIGRQKLIGSPFAGWRIEDRYSLGRFLGPTTC